MFLAKQEKIGPTPKQLLQNWEILRVTGYIATNQSKVNDAHFPTLFESEAVQGFFCRRSQFGGFEKYLCHFHLFPGDVWCRRLCYVC